MHSKRVWSLNHDITTSLGLGISSIFLNSTPALHRRNSVRVHPYAYPRHIKVLKHLYTYDMDVGCTPSGFGASTMIL
jgi:hypothetical protein